MNTITGHDARKRGLGGERTGARWFIPPRGGEYGKHDDGRTL